MKKEQVMLIRQIICQMIKTENSLLRFVRSTVPQEEKKNITKLIRHSEKALEYVKNIHHEEILFSLYNSFVLGKEQYYAVLGESVYKNVKKWDTTKKGFETFKKLEKTAQKEFAEKVKKEKESKEAIQKAKEEGKKVEFVYKDGKLEPLILEEKKN